MPALDFIGRRSALYQCSLLLCLVFALPARAGDQAEVPIGRILPNAALHGLNGPSRALDSFRGKPLIINVWASWCGPCRQEMASLERLAWHDQARQFAIIGISTDDDAAQAAGMLKNINATISQFIDRDLEMENMLGASRLPLTVLVAADGRILERIYGAREWDSPESLKLIEEALRRSPASH
jgi:thiol-disulfide isomerase/thioredoxin